MVPGGKVYVDSNVDRFGLPIRPMKPLDLFPGPGEYEVQDPIFPVPVQLDKKIAGGYVSEYPIPRELPQNNEKGIPGPALYNANKEPKKISFLFNPSEKWV